MTSSKIDNVSLFFLSLNSYLKIGYIISDNRFNLTLQFNHFLKSLLMFNGILE